MNQPNKRGRHKQCTILKIKSYDGAGGYTRILNETLRDRRLSGMARGILAYALSRPSNWQTRSWELQQEFRCGEWAIRIAMEELVSADYARLDLVRAPDGKVTGRAWLIRESPKLAWSDNRRNVKNKSRQKRASPRRG